MGPYILRRIMISIPVLIVITVALFVMINLAPGDPIMAMLDPEAVGFLDDQQLEERRRQLGLDQPLPVRYLYWLGELVTGNFGFSYHDGRPVTTHIGERLEPTIRLYLTSQLIALAVAVPMGILSAVRQYSRTDYVLTIFSFLAVSVPNFFLALGFIYVFAVVLGWAPTSGMGTVRGDPSLLNSIHHLILPATVLGLTASAPLIRYIRSSMLETLGQDYVVVARAKGLRSSNVMTRHVLRNSLIPVVTILALSLPSLIGGTVIIEVVFSWPGMGTLLINSLRRLDYPTLMGVNLIIAVAIVLSNLAADVIYALLDPRIKYS